MVSKGCYDLITWITVGEKAYSFVVMSPPSHHVSALRRMAVSTGIKSYTEVASG